MEPGDEIEQIRPVLGKDLYEDHLTIPVRIPTEGLEHGDKLHVSVELLERGFDTKAQQIEDGESNNDNNDEEVKESNGKTSTGN